MDDLEKYLIVGLGNPGLEYQSTRHNAGYRIVQAYSQKHKGTFKHVSHLLADLAQVTVHGKKVYILTPTTFMNSSGDAVRRCVDYFKVPLDHLFVVCDDVALQMGSMRMRSKGSCGGHNGLRSIQEHLNTEYFVRLRIGVGAPENQVLADYVLGHFSSQERDELEKVSFRALEVLDLMFAEGLAKAMQAANTIKNEKEKNNG